ncbi:hypothetical protein RvY_11809 [Ramazzottius varieornatus]|uniref:Uncharacterized protein n=1 Tax=Ramazzottius varieornatus TaxID=947166 RepID=A0A1D1VQ13_RAMVA|nr:hypothetical protein RvY_11809 [Ramazzottius varieornatus]
MSKVLGDESSSKSTAEYWYRTLHRKIFDLEDALGLLLRRAPTKDYFDTQADERRSSHHRQEYSAETQKLDISVGTAEHKLHGHLNLQEIGAPWVPHGLTENQRQQKVRRCEQMLHILKRDVVTSDESCIYYYDPKRKEYNKEWVEKDKLQVNVIREHGSNSGIFCSCSKPVEAIRINLYFAD